MTHRGMLGKRVVDTEGIELGVISSVKDGLVEVSEGLFDELIIATSYIGSEREEEVVLKDTLPNMLEGMEVEGSDGNGMGFVKEIIYAGDVLDMLIIETPEKELFFITLEEIYRIQEKMELDIDLGFLKEEGRLKD